MLIIYQVREGLKNSPLGQKLDQAGLEPSTKAKNTDKINITAFSL